MGALVFVIAGVPLSYMFYISLPVYEYESERVHFKVFMCKEPADIRTPTQFLVREWLREGEFHVRALESSACDRHFSSAAFRVAANSLTLEYRTRPWDKDAGLPRPACDCRFELDYVIKGLEKRNWNVEIRSPDLPEEVYDARKKGGAIPPPPPAPEK